MPGETRNYTFKLPVAASEIDTFLITFYQNDEKILQYDENSDNIAYVATNPYYLVCTLPRVDTLLFENGERAEMQMEWEIDGYHSVAKPQRISVGNYLYKEYLGG